jgi:hypothetical protein
MSVTGFAVISTELSISTSPGNRSKRTKSKEFSSESEIGDNAITMDSLNEDLDKMIDQEAKEAEKQLEED